MKKAILTSIAVVLMLFLLPSCAPGASLQEYVNSTYDYKISYPKSWEIDLTQAPKLVTIYKESPRGGCSYSCRRL